MAAHQGKIHSCKEGMEGKCFTKGSSGSVSSGLLNLEMKFAHARPNTTRSNKELAPSLFAPWTEAHADSPAAQRPGTTSSLPSFFVKTWKWRKL